MSKRKEILKMLCGIYNELDRIGDALDSLMAPPTPIKEKPVTQEERDELMEKINEAKEARNKAIQRKSWSRRFFTRHVWTKEEEDILINLYNKGLSMDKIAKAMPFDCRAAQVSSRVAHLRNRQAK